MLKHSLLGMTDIKHSYCTENKRGVVIEMNKFIHWFIDSIIKTFKLFIFTFFILQFSLFNLQCKKPTPPDSYVPSIHIEIEELGVTEVWLKIKFTSTDVPKGFSIKRNGNTIAYVPNPSTDTVLIDTDLLPNQIYFYRAYKLIDNKIIDSSDLLQVTTLDSTSHEFTWEIDTLGGIQSRVNGLWGSDINNVYAVGYFNLDTTSHLARWDGSKWTYLRPDVINGWNGIRVGELTKVYGISANKVFVVGYGFTQQWGRDSTWGFIAEWDGIQWKNISPNAPGEYFISIWASSENDIWITTAHGFVYHYSGSNWEKLSTGTDYYFSDIWGFSNKEIYIAGHPGDYSTGIMLKYKGQIWERVNILPPSSIVSFRSVWGTSSRYLFVASFGGLFTNKNGYWQDILYPGIEVALFKVRGSSKNNVFVCGPFGKILHYNGYNWKNYEIQFSGYDYLNAIHVFDNVVFIGGIGGRGFESKGIVLRGRR